jgi:S1-C subfamily serine protease
VRVYDEVVSVGNAGGRGYLSAAAGPVLRLGSSIGSVTDSAQDTPLTGLIQARSGIRPGESGGAMLNTRGQVIGINVAYAMTRGKRSPSGVGYAIPINHALCVAEHLITVAEKQND